MWVKFRLLPLSGKVKRPESVQVENPHLSFLSDEFLRLVARKLGITLRDIKTKYEIIYQRKGMADFVGVPVKETDSFYSLKILDGAPFLCVEKEQTRLLSSFIFLIKDFF